MALIYHELNIPLDTDSTFDYVAIKQGDSGSHKVRATLINNNSVYTIPTSNVTHYFKFRKPDNTFVLVQATVSNNQIIADVTEEMLRVAGTGRGEFMIVQGSTELKTATFYFKIVPQTYTTDDVISSSDFATFASLLAGAGNAASNANAAAAAANAAAANAEAKADLIPDDYTALVQQVEDIQDELENLDVETDETLTEQGKPADAKATGDAIAELNGSLGEYSLAEKVVIPNHNWTHGTINSNGSPTTTGYYVYHSSSPVDVFNLPESFTYTGPETYTKDGVTATVYCFVYQYAKDGELVAGAYLGRQTVSQGGIFKRHPDCTYVRFTIGFTQASGMSILWADAVALFSIKAVKSIVQTEMMPDKISWRKSMILARARQFASIGYQPLAKIPNQVADYKTTNYYVGVPYSSVRAIDTFVGINVSLHTFATMLKNPRSVIYKRKSTNSNSKTYVGTVCSAFVDYCYGLDFPITVSIVATMPEFVQKNFLDIAVGDVLLNSQHGVLIYRIIKDEYGRPVKYGIVQAAAGNSGHVEYGEQTPSELKTYIVTNNYEIYEYVGDTDNDYVPCQYVKGYPDDTLDLTYPDIMSEYGDKAVIKAGLDVTINVISATGYTSIEVYKDNALVDTKSTVEDFVIEDITYGTWKVKLVGDGISSESQFIAVDMSGCSYDETTHIVTFGSANATPIGINTYGKSDGGMSKLVRLSDADRNRGTYNATELVGTGNPGIRVALKTPWGQTAWRSSPTDYWTTYNG